MKKLLGSQSRLESPISIEAYLRRNRDEQVDALRTAVTRKRTWP